MSRLKREEVLKRYHHGDLRRALLDTAERLLQEQGADGLSLRSIARSAGVSHGAPYHHFADMEDLLAAIASSGFTRLRDRMLDQGRTGDHTPIQKLRWAGIAYVQFAAENPELYRLMFSGRLRRTSNQELAEASSAAYATLGELLGRVATEPGAAEQSGDQPAAQAAWATVHGLAMLIIDGRLDVDRNDSEAVENAALAVTEVLGRGLGSVLGS